MDSVECIVVGAGVVGLAIARQLAGAGRDVLVLDRQASVGTEISSRNSEVIHSGMYYGARSLKARTCVRGRELLYEYCDRRAVPFRRCVKLVVAVTPGEVAPLRRLASTGQRNGVLDLTWLTGESARHLEPELRCIAALHSPSTGILDSHALMLAMQADAEDAGAVFAFRTEVDSIRATSAGLEVRISDPIDSQITARWLVNCAGLRAVALAKRTIGLAPETVPKLYLAKGTYFALAGSSPFSRLVYPIPTRGALGIHLTIDMAGYARFGPDIEWIDAIDYSIDSDRSKSFYDAIRRYWPGVTERCLTPAYAGIRPKINGPRNSAADFRIQSSTEHGVYGLINLFGIESPGLTSSMAIAEEVSRLIRAPQ